MARAPCKWDALKCEPTTQQLHDLLDIQQKTAKIFWDLSSTVYWQGLILKSARPRQIGTKQSVFGRQTLY